MFSYDIYVLVYCQCIVYSFHPSLGELSMYCVFFFIPLDERDMHLNIFTYFSMEIYVVGTC